MTELPVKELHLDSPCPACRVTGVVMRSISHDVPHFGEALETLLFCPHCGFRHVDFLILQQKDPLRYAFEVRDEADLRVRVIRSNSGTIRVPEVGFLAEPTPRSESFVSNIEGVLDRVIYIFEMAKKFNADNPEAVAVADAGIARLQAAKEGRERLTVIIDDPFGNSAIVSDRAERRTLTQEEVDALHTGLIILDKADFARLEGETS